MQVVHLITTICRGGAETQLLTLVREQVRLGDDVIVLFLKGEPELQLEFEEAGAEVRHELVGKNFLFQFILLQKFLLSKSCILHAHLPKSELLASLIYRRNVLILSKHNAEQFYPTAPEFISRLLAQFVSKRSDGVIYISNAVHKFVTQKKEIDSRIRSWVVYYGFNPTYNRASISKMNEASDRFTIGTVSRLADQKDLGTLLRGLKLLREKVTSASLLVIGKGPQENYLKSLARELNLGQSIRWLPQTSNVYEQISKLNIFCLTSKYEGFGLVLLEAMQCSTPIVAARNSAITEVLGEDYPYFFNTSNPEDLCEKIILVSQPKNYSQAVEYLERRLLKFEPGVMAEKIQEIYKELINR